MLVGQLVNGQLFTSSRWVSATDEPLYEKLLDCFTSMWIFLVFRQSSSVIRTLTSLSAGKSDDKLSKVDGNNATVI